jgi:hypothetical protein
MHRRIQKTYGSHNMHRKNIYTGKNHEIDHLHFTINLCEKSEQHIANYKFNLHGNVLRNRKHRKETET